MMTPALPDVAATHLTLVDDTGADLRYASREYQLERGWTTTVRGHQLLLDLDDDTWGLLMPTDVATALLAELHAMRLSCPIVGLPGTHDRRSILLLEPERAATPRLPAAVSRLPSGTTVALPPSVTPNGPVYWLAPHDPPGSTRPAVQTVADTLTRVVGPPV
ncbi:hypothetical protein [Actinophytocola sediminis]